MKTLDSRSRQKACNACSASKTRCIRRTGGCVRCAQKGFECSYPGTRFIILDSDEHQTTVTAAKRSSEQMMDTPEVTSVPSLDLPSVDLLSRPSDGPSSFPTPPTDGCSPAPGAAGNFSNLNLVCPIDAADISNRWLKAYIPNPTGKSKQYSGSTVFFIYRILRSYASVVVQGEGIPAFIHHLQVHKSSPKTPLSTSLDLVHIFNGSTQNTEVLGGIILQEMARVYDSRCDLDPYAVVAAFQAYAIYTLVLFFYVSDTHESLWQAMMNLQDLASASARAGCMCRAEEQHVRPRWEEWIVAESQRRTLYAMYMFDSVLSSRDGLPTFLGTELSGLPAPSNGLLWRAASRSAWEAEYNRQLAAWPGGMLGLAELWPMPSEFDDNDIRERRARVDRWLINLDEYGTMLYAVTSGTHGS